MDSRDIYLLSQQHSHNIYYHSQDSIYITGPLSSLSTLTIYTITLTASKLTTDLSVLL